MLAPSVRPPQARPRPALAQTPITRPTHARVSETPAAGGHAADFRPAADRLGRRDGGPDQPLVPPGVHQPGHRSRALRVGRGLARRLLPRREDRVHRQPDRAEGRRVRCWRRTAGCRCRCSARRPPRRSARPRTSTRRSRCTPSSSRSIPGTGPIEVRGRVDGRRLSLDVKTPSGTRSEVRELDGAAGAVAEHVAAPRQRRPGARRQVPVDRVRSGDAAQLEGQRRGRPARAGARRRRRAAPGVPRRDGVRRPEDLVVDHRHRRGRARGEPARADHRARVGRQRAGDGGVAADAGGPAAGGRRRAADADADRRAARRPPDAHSARRRRSVARSISTAARSV